MRAENDEQGADMEPMPRLIVKLDSEPKLELNMKQGNTLSVEYRSVDYHDGTSATGDRKEHTGRRTSRLQELVLAVEKTLCYIDNIDKFPLFLSYLGIGKKELKGDKLVALIEQYKEPGREEEGLRALLDHANKFASKLRASE